MKRLFQRSTPSPLSAVPKRLRSDDDDPIDEMLPEAKRRASLLAETSKFALAGEMMEQQARNMAKSLTLTEQLERLVKELKKVCPCTATPKTGSTEGGDSDHDDPQPQPDSQDGDIPLKTSRAKPTEASRQEPKGAPATTEHH
jgi:hypothetical protein